MTESNVPKDTGSIFRELCDLAKFLRSTNLKDHADVVHRGADEIERLRSALTDVRVFVQDCLDTGHDRGSIGNLMSARDAIDRALSAEAGCTYGCIEQGENERECPVHGQPGYGREASHE